MLSLSGAKDFVSSLNDLNISPVTISYEWEPCDSMKVRELYLSETQTYVKEESEDLRSIIGGVVSQKGNIHLHIGHKMNHYINEIDPKLRINDFLHELAILIDHEIQANYKLWPSNYYAYDQFHQTNEYESKYNDSTIEIFEKRFKQTLELTGGPYDKIRKLFLKLYANPVINKKDTLTKKAN